MTPLFMLNGDIEINESEADENELLAEASDMIPICIAGIHEFWRNRQRDHRLSARRRARGGRKGR